MDTKVCIVCQIPKPLGQFSKTKRAKDGHRGQCRECYNQRNAANKEAWKKAHPGKIRAARKKWADSHPEQVRATAKAWWEAHREEACEYAKGYRARHPEKVSAYQARYKKEHRKEIAECQAIWRETHREESRAYSRHWYKTHPIEAAIHRMIRKARVRNAPIVEKVSLDYLYKRDKGICQICHKPCKRQDASCDHVIPVSKGGEHSRRNCVLTHLFCNMSKGNRVVPQQQLLFG